MAGGDRWRGLRSACRAAAGMVAALALGAACTAPVSIEEFEADSGVAAPVQPVVAPTTSIRIPEQFRDLVEGAAPGAGGPSTAAGGETAASGPVTGFGDGALVASTALAAFEGERSLSQVALYDGYGIVVAIAPNGDVDRVVVRRGRADRPAALPTAMVSDPDGERFAPSDLDWGIVPGLVERTPADLGIEGGQVSHVIVEKNLPFSPDLVIRVYVSTERRSGRIDYFADGRVRRAFPG